MSKKSKPRAAAAGGAGSGRVVGGALVAGCAAVLIGLHLAHRTPHRSGSSPAPLGALTSPLLDTFSAEHNASLLWGTYRPGVYFGLRSRTAPTAAVAGLLWGSGTAQQLEKRLRHECEQDALER